MKYTKDQINKIIGDDEVETLLYSVNINGKLTTVDIRIEARNKLRAEQRERLQMFVEEWKEKENMKLKNISLLRQWLNEDRIKDAGRFVTDDQIRFWLEPRQTETKLLEKNDDEDASEMSW